MVGSNVAAPPVTNPVEKAGDVVINSSDQILTGGIAGVTVVGHGLSRGLGKLFMAPFKSDAEAAKEYGV